MEDFNTLSSVKPWERIAWSPEREQIIYRDWGVFYTQKQQLNIAAHYYNKSLELNDEDKKALLYRSKCKRNIAQTESALEDGRRALKIDPGSAPINLENCDTLFELNQFENCKKELHENTRRFFGKKVTSFLDRLVVVDENFNDSLGDSLSPFILKNEKYFAAVLEHLKRLEDESNDKRPLWKILRDQGKCDVVSLLEKEDLLLSPREIARRQRAFKVFNQIYFNKSWIDVSFLKELKDNPNLIMQQSKVSAPYLHNLVHTKYGVVKKFLKMLQARSPLYNEQSNRCPNKDVWEYHHNNHMNRIQYQTRRTMLATLRSIRHMRTAGSVDKLARYIEEFMGNYVVLKTHRVMPWKFEFMSEVYNTMALAFSDKYVIPNNIMTTQEKDRLLVLLRMPTDKNKEILRFVFGDKSTFQEADAPDLQLIAYKRFLTRLEKRMKFAKHSIEKCYLLHEIARSHLKQSRHDECCSVARRAAEEAKSSNHNLWQFLSIMLICKSHAVLYKVERGKEALDEAHLIADRLKNSRISAFIDLCRSINEMDLSMKKKTQSIDSIMRKRRSRSSIGSRNSQYSRESGDDRTASETHGDSQQ